MGTTQHSRRHAASRAITTLSLVMLLLGCYLAGTIATCSLCSWYLTRRFQLMASLEPVLAGVLVACNALSGHRRRLQPRGPIAARRLTLAAVARGTLSLMGALWFTNCFSMLASPYQEPLTELPSLLPLFTALSLVAAPAIVPLGAAVAWATDVPER